MSGVNPKNSTDPINPNQQDLPPKKPTGLMKLFQAIGKFFTIKKQSSTTITAPKKSFFFFRQNKPAPTVKKDAMVASVKSTLQPKEPKKLFESDEKRYEAIKILIPFLEAKGVDTVGIFRTAGSKNVTNAFLEKFTANLDPTINIEHLGTDEVIDALKSIVKEVNFASGHAFVEIWERQTTHKEVESEGRLPPAKEVTKLPLTAAQRTILDEVLRYAVKIAAESTTNKMDAHNLAIVIAPWFGSKSPDMAEQMRSMQDNPKIVEFFEAIIANNVANIENPEKQFKFA